MNLKLRRLQYSFSGIFGELLDPSGKQVAVTLEGAFKQAGSYLPKISLGHYRCVVVGEAIEVGAHSLMRCGNWNSDSDGSILVGCYRLNNSILESKIAFQRILDIQSGVDTFTLTITN